MAKAKKSEVVEPVADQIAPKALLLDPENPRLASHAPVKLSQDDIAAILWSEMSVDEVAMSIAKNGFYPNEPLLVVKEGDKYVVVEGNRRFAAVRILLEKKLRDHVKADLPALEPQYAKTLDALPVLIYPNRKVLWATLGFRHVNGTKPWDAFSKAEFVAKVHEEYGVPLDEIAEKIGDRHQTVVRFYRGFVVMRQAEAQTSFSRDDLWRNRFYFSHLYTALDQPEFKKFLGLKEGKTRADIKRAPIPHAKLPQLEELLKWIYGKKSENQAPIVQNQFPDLNHLRRILADRVALSLLRAGAPLERAFDASKGDANRFEDAVVRAKAALQEARATVTTGYQKRAGMLEMMKDVVDLAGKINAEMLEIGSKGKKPRGKARV